MCNVENNLISVIIPVYNVEKYIERCILSVLKQTYSNLEILLIDDGSTDNSGKICDKYAEQDDRVYAVHIENQGVGNARNQGRELSKGKYLYFIDSDDWIPDNAIELMMVMANQTNADLVTAERVVVKEGSFEERRNVYSERFEIWDSRDAIDYYADKNWAAWNKLYKREVHENILYPKYEIYEDEATMFPILDHCNVIVHMHSELYYYFKRANSATTLVWSLSKYDGVKVWKNNIEYLAEKHPFVFKRGLSKFVDICLYNLVYLMKDKEKYEKPITDILLGLKKYRTDILFNQYLRFTKKIRVLIFCLSRGVYQKIYT